MLRWILISKLPVIDTLLKVVQWDKMINPDHFIPFYFPQNQILSLKMRCELGKKSGPKENTYKKEAEHFRDSLFTLFCYELIYTITLLWLFRPFEGTTPKFVNSVVLSEVRRNDRTPRRPLLLTSEILQIKQYRNSIR